MLTARGLIVAALAALTVLALPGGTLLVLLELAVRMFGLLTEVSLPVKILAGIVVLGAAQARPATSDR